jgi:YHS domain-containing protein
MNCRLYYRLIAATFAAAMLCLTWQATAEPPTYAVRPNCNSYGTCNILPGTYGYNDTGWRQWPTQYRPDVSDPRGVGGTMIPPPPGVPEIKRPALPSRPPTSGGGAALLPGGPGSSSSGSMTLPGGLGPITPGPEVLPGLPGLPGTILPLTEPKPSGEGAKPALPTLREPSPKEAEPKEAAPSGKAEPGAGLPIPGLSIPGLPIPKPTIMEPSTLDPARTPNREKPNIIPPKLDAPPLSDPAPVKPGIHGAAVRRGRGTIAADQAGSQPGADVPATPSQPDAVLDPTLRRTSFEQRSAKATTALPVSLDGYCPVELQDGTKWTAGHREFQTVYQGRVFQFSSAAALKRFVAAPEKYAPAQGGNDPVLAMEEDHTVQGSIQHSAVWRGRLYLFASAANLAAFREDPSRYATRSRPAEDSPRVPQTAMDDAAPLPDTHLPSAGQQLQLPSNSL